MDHSSCRTSCASGMPVKWLLYWQPIAGSPVNSQTLMDVMRCIESINGVKTGRWHVTSSHYRPITRDQALSVDCARELLGVSFSEAAGKYFFVLRNEHMVVEADMTMQNIMEKLQLYANRINLVFEGYQYQLGDFQLKAGRAILAHNETLRGIVLEVEYLPLCSFEQGRAAMQEFLALWKDVVAGKDGLGGYSLTGQFAPLELNYSDYSLDSKIRDLKKRQDIVAQNHPPCWARPGNNTIRLVFGGEWAKASTTLMVEHATLLKAVGHSTRLLIQQNENRDQSGLNTASSPVSSIMNFISKEKNLLSRTDC